LVYRRVVLCVAKRHGSFGKTGHCSAQGSPMKKLALAALALAVLVAGNAVAQQFTVYDAGGRYLSTNTRNGNVTVSSNGSMYSVRHGNRGTLYDQGGRVLMNSVKRGNAVHHYDSRGRLVGKSYYRADGGFNMYNAKGRYVGQGVKNQ
jgi:hypothetical protein